MKVFNEQEFRPVAITIETAQELQDIKKDLRDCYENTGHISETGGNLWEALFPNEDID